jgi:4-amino-4-deoxy-L-arabinose transferase-like glycosyltransferase
MEFNKGNWDFIKKDLESLREIECNLKSVNNFFTSNLLKQYKNGNSCITGFNPKNLYFSRAFEKISVQKKHYYLLFLPILVVYVVNLFIDVMAVDATQYAEMSREMLTTKSFLKVHFLGADYLDKPPLLFWLNSLSFYLFGVGNASYKLPSLLFALLAIYSTYRFAMIFYSRQTAMMAALMLATTEALFLITNDVRTDTILMGTVIFAIWQWAQFFETNETKNLLLGSIGVGLALLAKGPIGLIAVSAALLPHIILSKKWRWLIDIRVALAIIVIGFMLAPMCIGLYEQWGWKGINFFFWTQSFGRITGESEWNNNPDTFFLLHSVAWAFLPWTLFLAAGWIDTIVGLINRKFVAKEIISISGFTLIMIALMQSRYQLPHYIFVVFPIAAVIAADFFQRAEKRSVIKKVLSVLQIIVLMALIALSCLLQYCLKGFEPLSLSCLVILYMTVIVVVIYTNGPVKSLPNIIAYLGHKIKRDKFLSPETHLLFDILYRHLFVLSAEIMIVFSFLVGTFYFPAIIKYQPDNDFGRYARVHAVGNNFVSYYCQTGDADIFYAQQAPIPIWDSKQFNNTLKLKKHLIVITALSGKEQLDKDHIKYKVIDERYRYPVTKLTVGFLDPATREGVCEKVYLLEAEI